MTKTKGCITDNKLYHFDHSSGVLVEAEFVESIAVSIGEDFENNAKVGALLIFDDVKELLAELDAEDVDEWLEKGESLIIKKIKMVR